MNQNMWNGFLVTMQPTDIQPPIYYGVDNQAWPAEFDKTVYPQLSNIADDCLTSFETPLLLDADALQSYLELCVCQDIPVRVLYCEVLSTEQQRYDSALHNRFATPSSLLGYDYAYPNGDYYSAVLNDLITRDLCFRVNFRNRLNPYGLFSLLKDMTEFIAERELMKSFLKPEEKGTLFEEGFFSIFRLFRVKDDEIILTNAGTAVEKG